LTAEYLDFEARQSEAHGMLLKPQWRAVQEAHRAESHGTRA
jgi:hypothetical protein